MVAAQSACVVDESYPLCHMPDAVVGSSQVEDNDDAALVTVQSTAIHVYTVGDQRCINSWSVDPSTVLTHYAIQHPKSKRIYVVENNRIVRSWDKSAQNLTDGTSQKFKNPVHAIIADGRLAGVVVLFTNGKAVQTDCDLTSNRPFSDSPQGIDSKSIPHAADVYTHNNDTILRLGALFRTTRTNPSSNTPVHVWQTYTLDEITMNTTLSDQFKLYLPSSVSSACLDTKSLTLSVVCVDGSLSIFDIASLDAAEVNMPRVSRTLTMFRFDGSVGTKPSESSAIAMTSSGPSLLAITGETPDHKYMMTVWETKYGTLQAQRELRDFDSNFNRQAKGHRNKYQISRLRSSNGTVFLSVCGRFVDVCIVYYTGSVSLVSAVGRMDEVNIATILSSNVATRETPSVSDLIDTNVYTSTIPNDKTLTAEWEEGLMETATVNDDIWTMLASESSDVFKEAAKMYLATLGKKGTSAVSPKFVKEVCNRMLVFKTTENVDDFFMEEILVDLVQRGSVSTCTYPNIIEAAQNYRSFSLLETCFIHMADIPEPMIVNTIQYLLDMDVDDLKALDLYFDSLLSKKKRKAGHKGRGVSAGLHHMLAAIVSTPMNDRFLQHALHGFSLKDVMALLEYEWRWLVLYGQHGSTKLNDRFSPSRIPTFKQVLNWIAVILDAEMARLVLFPDSRQLLVECKEAIAKEAMVCEQAQDLQGYISSFSTHCVLPAVTQNPVYSIEQLEI
eukprot:CFRG7106T1